MDIAIRTIEPADYPAFADIFIEEIMGGGRDYDTSLSQSAQFLDAVNGDERYRTWVALSQGRVIGFISVAMMRWIASENMFVQCFAVSRAYQRRGIGTALLRHAQDYAKAHGISGMGLQSGVKREGAHAFYERSGFTKSFYFYKNF